MITADVKLPCLPTVCLVLVTTDDYHVTMRSIGIADLKARLSEHLRYVRRGHDVTILDRDTPVARLIPWHKAAALTIRKPLGRQSFRDVPLPPPLRLEHDPLVLLLEERQGER